LYQELPDGKHAANHDHLPCTGGTMLAWGRAGGYHGGVDQPAVPDGWPLQGVNRLFRSLRWHLAKARLAAMVSRPPPYIRLHQQRDGGKAEDWPPNTDPYQKLATLWEDYAHWFVPEYGRFLEAAGRHYSIRLQCVLDLACGTGLLSRQIARRAGTVVGLDISRPMLQQAGLKSRDNVRYVEGDFRDFCLDEVFNAVVCGCDSLNYVETAEEMLDVFRCVGRHLRPGGIFAFDVLDGRYFRATSPRKVVVVMGDREFAFYQFYDSQRRVSEARVVAGTAVERHRRVPIEEEDVRWAAAAADLAVTDTFVNQTYYPRLLSAVRRFYVLQKPQAKGGNSSDGVAASGPEGR
jgi:SAM-dependent methyltransferase